MGRILNNWQCTPRVCSYLLIYTYDLLGNMTSSTNGVGGVTLNYAYNGAPRITGITSTLSDATHPPVLLSGVKYGIAGPTASSLGDGIAETRTYDPRLGLQSYKAGSVYSYTLTKAPNGNITGGNDSANGAWSYSYDPFNRLATAGKTDQAFAYDYDRFGNRWKQRLTSAGSSTQQPSYTFDGYNHITNSGFAYDALGNVTNDGTHSYTYDAENRLIHVDGGATAYTYDAEGRRVRAATVGGPTLEFLFDLNGKAITKLNGNNGNWAAGEIYAGGQHIATYANSTTYFHHQDWLGAKRVSTDPTGAVVETCTNLPFGDGGSCTGANAGAISFTDFDHDSESNLEHAWFRQLSTTQGRWMTPDPYSGSMNLGNPQSFNRYTDVGNDPVNLFDPLGLAGHEAKCISDQGCFEGGGGGPGSPTCLLDGAPIDCGWANDIIFGGTGWIVPNGAQIIGKGDWAGCYLSGDTYHCPENAPFFSGRGALSTTLTQAPSNVPKNGWDWDENHYGNWPKNQGKPRQQSFGACFDGAMRFNALPGGSNTQNTITATTAAATIWNLILPNPVAKTIGALNAFYNLSRIVPAALVCSTDDAHF